MREFKKPVFRLLLLCLISIYSKGAFAQRKAESQSKIICYKVTNVQGNEQLQNLKSQIQQMKYVTNVDVKAAYEDEGKANDALGKADIYVYVTEIVKDESKDSFDQIGLKHMILSSGMNPEKFSIKLIN